MATYWQNVEVAYHISILMYTQGFPFHMVTFRETTRNFRIWHHRHSFYDSITVKVVQQNLKLCE